MQVSIRTLSCLLLGTLFSACSQGASFDCASASTPSETAICDSTQLSKLDVEMASTYSAASGFTATGDTTTRQEQRDWLRRTRSDCDRASNIVACLSDRYADRLSALKELPSDARTQLAAPVTYSLTDASTTRAFAISLSRSCRDETCESPGQLSVSQKGAAGRPQLIDLPNISMTRRNDGSVLANTSGRYGYQGTINVGDFNFDGAEDLAVQTGNSGSYGGPSYDVFLYDASRGRYLYSPALSALTIIGLGFFEVDETSCELIVYTKDGCCYHEETHYSVQSNMPAPKFRRVDDTRGSRAQSFMETFAGGKWKRTRARH